MRTKVDPADRIYRRAVQREGKFWKGQSDDPANPAHLPTPLVKYKAAMEGGNRFQQLAKRGPFKKGLTIGCGSANVEIELLKRGIVKEFTFIDISEGSLRKLRDSLPQNLQRRAHISNQDLNFISLEENTYDFIFVANVLHHIVNLEHVLLEMNKALTSGGILYVDDYIGENRFQFSDARIRLINRTGALTQERTGIHFTPLVRTSRKALINSCPFEAVRSEDILPLLNKIFGKRTVRQRTYGAVSSWMNVVIEFRMKTAEERKQLDAAARLFVAADRKTRVPPLFMHGIYRKNATPPNLVVQPWTEKELARHLPVSIFDEGIMLRAGGALQRLIGNRVLYQAIKRSYLRMRG